MSYFDLLVGAGYGKKQIRRQAELSALVSSGQAIARRRRYLELLLAQGKLTHPTPSQSSILGGGFGLSSANAKVNARNKLFGLDLGIFGRGLRDVGDVATGLPQGVYELGKMAAHDFSGVLSTPGSKPGSQIAEKVIKPLPGLIARDFREAGQHPLYPILDVLGALSGGATAVARGGGLLARAARTGSGAERLGTRLAGITSRQGRAPLTLNPERQTTPGFEFLARPGTGEFGLPRDITGFDKIPGTSMPRYYSPSPVRKYLIQKPSDVLTTALAENKKLGFDTEAGGLQQRWATGKLVNRQSALARLGGQELAARAQSALVPVFRSLNADEATALTFAMRGINTPERLAAAQDLFHKSLAGQNPEGSNLADFAHKGVDENYVERLGNLPDSIVEKVLAPTENMKAAAQAWELAVDEEVKKLAVSPEEHAQRVGQTQQLVDREVQGLTTDPGKMEGTYKATAPEGYDINPTYVPDVLARGEMKGEEFRPAGGRRRQKLGREATQETVLSGPPQGYLNANDLRLFASGAFRTDVRSLLEHVGRRERDVIAKHWSNESLQALAVKGMDGNAKLFTDQAEIDRFTKTDKQWQFIPADGSMVRWYRAERNLLDDMVRTVEGMKNDGTLTDFGSVEELNTLKEQHGRRFKREWLGASKAKGYAIPTDAYRQIQQIMKVNDPLPFRGAAAYQNFLNKWRVWVLTYMPRWWVNTAVGSAFMAVVKGTWDPRVYMQAKRLLASGDVPPGVRLGFVAAELDSVGQSGMLNATFPTRLIHEKVQAVEDHFRTAAFVQSMNKEARQAMREVGDVIYDFKSFGGPLDDEQLRALMADSRTVEAAMDDVDKFFYNYGQLGAFERRYVRMAIPFWGWYKFITKFVWRLPIEYPGRMAVMAKMSQIGTEALREEFGGNFDKLPPWLRGTLILNGNLKNLQYLSTMGLNPMSNFLNPGSIKGVEGGVLQLGQLSPVLQAALISAGVDTMTGDRVAISPAEGVGFDFFGEPWDVRSGRQLGSLGERAGGRRFVGSLLRAFPQYRFTESFLAGGRPVFPESIPFGGLERPIPVRGESRRDFSLLGVAQMYSGIDPKQKNVQRTLALDKKRLEDAKSKNKSDLKRLKRRLSK